MDLLLKPSFLDHISCLTSPNQHSPLHFNTSNSNLSVHQCKFVVCVDGKKELGVGHSAVGYLKQYCWI